MTEEEIKEAEVKVAEEEAAKAEEARIAEEETVKAEEEAAAKAAEEEGKKKEFKPDMEAAYRREQENNRQLREQNQQMLNRLDMLERQARAVVDSKEFDEILGDGGTNKLKNMIRNESKSSSKLFFVGVNIDSKSITFVIPSKIDFFIFI